MLALTKRLEQLDERGGIRLLCFFLAVLALKWPWIVVPPVWDEAMGVFPAALTLVEHHFHIFEVLKLPTYLQGGPNTHVNSLLTIWTAVVLALVGPGKTAWAILHLIQFGLAAVGMNAFYAIARKVTDRGMALAITVAAFVFPLFFAQVGFMYTELPLFVFAALTLRAYLDGKWVQTCVFAALACAIKESSFALVVAMSTVMLLSGERLVTSIRRIVVFCAAPAIIAVAGLALAPDAGGGAHGGLMLRAIPNCVGQFYGNFLSGIPDLTVISGLTLMFAPFVVVQLARGMRDVARSAAERQRAAIVVFSFTLVAAFVSFHLIVVPVVIYPYCAFLPRYFAQVSPFMILAFVAGIVLPALPGRLAFVFVAALSVFFVANSEGRFYPPHVNNAALAERSGEYMDGYIVQDALMRAAQKVPDAIDVYYGLPEHFLMSYPGLGYMVKTPARRHALLRGRKERGLADFPACFVVLSYYPLLGGEFLTAVKNQASATPGRAVRRAWTAIQGNFIATIDFVVTESDPCAQTVLNLADPSAVEPVSGT